MQFYLKSHHNAICSIEFFLNGRLDHLTNLLNYLNAIQLLASSGNSIQMGRDKLTMLHNLKFCVKLLTMVNSPFAIVNVKLLAIVALTFFIRIEILPLVEFCLTNLTNLLTYR